MSDTERERLVARVEATRERMRERLAIEIKTLSDYDAAIAKLIRGNQIAAAGWESYQSGKEADDWDRGLAEMMRGQHMVGEALEALEEIRAQQPRGDEEG